LKNCKVHLKMENNSERVFSVKSQVDDVIRRANSNFHTAFYFLPPEKRRAVQVFYAFCREVDDAVDMNFPDNGNGPSKIINFWRNEIERVRKGEKTFTPLGEEIKEVIHIFGGNLLNYFELILDGVEMDVFKRRYHNFDELYEYCYRVASSVGFFCVELFGMRSKSAMRYAELTGVAVQLTNILRDIKEDFQRGRVYIPIEDMNAFGVSEKDFAETKGSEKLKKLLDFEAVKAKTLFEMGRASLKRDEVAKLYFCHLLSGTYESLLDKLRKGNFYLDGKKIKVSTIEKLVGAMKTIKWWWPEWVFR